MDKLSINCLSTTHYIKGVQFLIEIGFFPPNKYGPISMKIISIDVGFIVTTVTKANTTC